MTVSLNYKFLLIASVLATVISALLNITVSNILWNGFELVPLWGRQSVASYLYSFSFFSNFVLVWMVTKATRAAIRNKQVLPLHWHLTSKTLIDSLPLFIGARAVILALSSCLMTGLTLYLLELKGYNSFYTSEFNILSTVFFVLQSAAIAIMAIYRAMGDNVTHHARYNANEAQLL